MQRVLIIGSPGSGKSTFAKKLAAQTGLPLIHLDDLYWAAGTDWVKVDRQVWKNRLQEALDGERWIIDGNYGSTLEQRAQQADTVYFLMPPRELCLWRVIWREVSGVHPHRPNLKRRLPEWEFVRYTWNFERKVPAMLDQLSQFKHVEIVVLRTSKPS